MSHPVSPLAPKALAALPPISGVRLATAAAGIRYQDRADVLYVAFDQGAAVAGVFTRSKCPSAPVDWCRRLVKDLDERVGCLDLFPPFPRLI